MSFGKLARVGAIALGLAGCALDVQRPRAEPTPSAAPTFEPGTRWEKRVAPKDTTVTALQFVNRLQGWLAGGNNRVYKTEDGGDTWYMPVALPSTWNPNVSEFVSVSFVDPRFGFLGGSYGVFKTENGGESWTRVQPFDHDNGPPPVDQRAYVRFRDYEHGVVVWQGAVHRTKDGGKTWQATPLGEGKFRQLGMIAGEFAILTDAKLWRSKPDGTWDDVPLPTGFKPGMYNPPYSSFHFLDGENGWVAGNEQLWRTLDGGVKWLPVPGAGKVLTVRFIDAARGWVAGKHMFKATRTGGATWVDVPGGTDAITELEVMTDIHILDSANVYVHGGRFGIWRWVAP